MDNVLVSVSDVEAELPKSVQAHWIDSNLLERTLRVTLAPVQMASEDPCATACEESCTNEREESCTNVREESCTNVCKE